MESGICSSPICCFDLIVRDIDTISCRGISFLVSIHKNLPSFKNFLKKQRQEDRKLLPSKLIFQLRQDTNRARKIGASYKMQRVSVKIFIMIIFTLPWCLAIFFIGNKFGLRSGYAEINKVKFSQSNLRNVKEKTPSYQFLLSNNVDKDSSKKKVIKIFGTKEPVSQNLSLEEIERRINSFYSYLDQQQYVKSYKFIKRTKKQFQQIFNMLEKKSPIVIREIDSIDDVLNNVFYFYRILGKERISLIKVY